MDLDAIVDAATVAPDAQPQADAKIEATKDAPQPESTEQDEHVEEVADEPWPKKAQNALAKEKGKTAKLKFERDQERQARAELEQRLAHYAKPQPTKAENTGEPKEADFNNYADFMEARTAYRIEQKFAERDGKQQQAQQTQQEQAWINQREQAVATQAQTLVKENPEVAAVIEEYADLAEEFSPQLQRLFLEADNAALAFYNLAKEGKLESLMGMSIARAAMEIGKAEGQAITKPKTKAPAPLPAARGSVAGGKRLEDLSGDEMRSFLRST